MKGLCRPEDLDPEPRRHLADWLLALADNKQLLGLRYAEWCTGAPELEADIAASAMAQYELGHARLLQGVLDDLPEDPRDEARYTDAATWRSLPLLDAPFAGWIDLVVANALLDTLLTVNLEAAATGGYQPLAQRLRKAVAEEHYHFVHAKAWFRRLAAGPGQAVAALRAATEVTWPQCVAWFGPEIEGGNSLDTLMEAGILAGSAAVLRARYLAKVQPIFEHTPIEFPARAEKEGWKLVRSIDWNDWSPASRRRGTPRFDDRSFAMVTGASARAMGVKD